MFTRSIVRLTGTLTAVIGLAGGAAAQQPAPIEATNAWSRATTPGIATGSIYLTLTSPTGDKLVGITSPAAAHAGVHEMQMDGNVMKMRAVEGGLDLPPGKPVTLSPGGYHIMLEGLKAPLKQGATVPVHLTFDKASPVDIEAKVQPIGSSGPKPVAPATPGMKMN